MKQLELLDDGSRRAGNRRAPIDWRAVERDYRTAGLSLRALGEKHGCSHSTIANFASRHGWSRESFG